MSLLQSHLAIYFMGTARSYQKRFHDFMQAPRLPISMDVSPGGGGVLSRASPATWASFHPPADGATAEFPSPLWTILLSWLLPPAGERDSVCKAIRDLREGMTVIESPGFLC